MLTLRIAIAALIWASALLAPVAAGEIMPSLGAAKNAFAPIERPIHAKPSVTASDAPPARLISYNFGTPDTGPPTPSPTDPNGPST
jgi:hypothetical protein